MKVVIVGAGTVGFQIARQLIKEEKDIVLIDKNPDKAKYASNYLDCMVINGSGNNIDTLKKAGVEKADFFISITDSDEVNMIACGLVSSEFKEPKTIARVRNIDYFSDKILENPFLGIDYIVNPEIEAVKMIIKIVEHGAVSDIMFFEQSNIQMRSILVDDDSIFNDKTIKQIKKILQKEFLIAGIERGEQFLIPSGDIIVQEQDIIYMIATKEEFKKIFSKIGREQLDIKDIVIVGGGRISSYLASYFLKQSDKHSRLFNKFKVPLSKKRNIKIIEKKSELCKSLSEEFPEALIINADISDESIFEEERLSEYDIIITTTENQELNILTALYSKTFGIKRAITLINNARYYNISSKLGIDATVSPKNSIINPILKYIRKGNIKSIQSISNEKIEVIELSIEKSRKVVGNKIMELNLPSQSLIVAISRKGENIVPNGNFVIEPGDNIIIICQKESIEEIEKIFTE